MRRLIWRSVHRDSLPDFDLWWYIYVRTHILWRNETFKLSNDLEFSNRSRIPHVSFFRIYRFDSRMPCSGCRMYMLFYMTSSEHLEIAECKARWEIRFRQTWKKDIEYLIGQSLFHNLTNLICKFTVNFVSVILRTIWKCSNGTFTDQSREMELDSHTTFGLHQGLKPLG